MDNGQLTMDNYQLFIINYQLQSDHIFRNRRWRSRYPVHKFPIFAVKWACYFYIALNHDS